MASRPPKKKPSSRRRSAASRKRGRGSAPQRRQKAGRKRSPLFVLCFWPFMLVTRLTRAWPVPLRIPVRAAGYAGLTIATLLLVGALFYYARALPYKMERVSEMPERSIIYDRNMRELGRLHGAHRDVVDLDEVSPHFRKALLAREDKNFRKHAGVDPRGVARAVRAVKPPLRLRRARTPARRSPRRPRS